MIGPKNNDFKSVSDYNSNFADCVAGLIIVGLAVDIIAAIALGKPWLETALTIVANTLIIVGVGGELWFTKRAREADDSRVAQAETALANAIDRASKLEKEAAELRVWAGDIRLDKSKFFNALDGKEAPSEPVFIMYHELASGGSSAANQIIICLTAVKWSYRLQLPPLLKPYSDIIPQQGFSQAMETGEYINFPSSGIVVLFKTHFALARDLAWAIRSSLPIVMRVEVMTNPDIRSELAVVIFPRG